MPSITDVAKRAGVSISTVSHVIHGTKHVSNDLTIKVNKAIRELDFELDRMAGSIKSKRTHNIGVVLPKITMIFFPDVLEGIEVAAKERGYKLFYISTNYNFEEEKENIRFLKSNWVDGILLDSCCKSADMQEYEEKYLGIQSAQKEIHIVSLESSFHSDSIGFVGIDHVKYTKMAINHLISLGHKDIAILEGPVYLPLCGNNMKAYQEALKEAGLEVKKENYLFGDYLPSSGYQTVKNAFHRQKPSWTALFAANDQMAIGAIKASLDLGIGVPDDLAIMGFDNVFPGTLIDPQLTTIDVPRFDLGYKALHLLVDKIEGKPIQENEIYLPGKLIARGSTVKNVTNDWLLSGW